MTYEDKQPRPENKPSNEPHWENNSLGSSSYDPYVNPPESPYSSEGKSELWPSGNPNPIYSQNQGEPYWAKNATPNPSTPSPQYSSNGLSPKGLRSPNMPGIPPEELAAMMPSAKTKDPNSPAAKPYRNPNMPGISPEELAAMRSEAEGLNSPAPKQLEPKGAMGYSLRELKELEKLVLPSNKYRESTQAIVRETESAANKSKGELSNTPAPGTPAKESLPADNHPLLPTEGTVFPEEVRKEYKQTHNVDMKGKIIPVKPELTQLLDTPMFARGGNIYVEEGKSTDPKSKPMQFEYANVVRGTKAKHRNQRNSILRYSQNDAWAAEQRKRQTILDNERRRKALADKAAADKAAADKRKADKAAADKRKADKRKADKAAADKRKADTLAKQSNETKTQVKKPTALIRRPPTDLSGLLVGNDVKKQPEQANQAQQRKEQLQKTVQAKSGLQNVLKDSTFNGTLVSGVLNPALGAQAFKGSNNFPGVSGKDKGTGAGSEQKKSGGFFSGALKMAQSSGIADMGQKILKGGSNLVDIAKTAPKPLLELANPAKMAASMIPGATGAFSALFGGPANAATVPSQAAVAPKPQEEKKKEEGGSWWDKAKNFTGSMVEKTKEAGTAAMKTANEIGKSVAKTTGDAWNGAAKWVSDHKAEIAIGVGVVALVAATVLTGGAALAVGGALLGGASVSGGTIALALGGGAVAGAGLNLAQQGAEIKKGAVDPATGQKKTDIDFGKVGWSAAAGAVTAPLGGAAFKLVPTIVGGAGVIGGGTTAVNAYNNITGNNFLTNNNPEKTKNGWSAVVDVAETGLALGPMAFKGARNAMFGAEARAQTAKSVGTVWRGTGKLAGDAWRGAGNLAGRVFGSGENSLASRAWRGTGKLVGDVWTGGGKLAGDAWKGGGELASRAWKGAGEITGRAIGGIQNWGSQVWTGARNWGIRGINATKNAVYDVKDALSPQHATPEGFSFGGDRPKDIPLIENKPMMMANNNPQGPQGPAITGETGSTSTGKEVHKDQADIRRNQEDFSTVNSPIKGKDGSEILVPKRVDLKTGEPQPGARLQEAIPDATIYKKGIVIDDKPLGRPIAKDRQEIIRFIKAYEVREGKLPKVIAIQRYDPKTGKPVVTELFKPEDFLP
jgi:hypothetical protein